MEARKYQHVLLQYIKSCSHYVHSDAIHLVYTAGEGAKWQKPMNQNKTFILKFLLHLFHLVWLTDDSDSKVLTTTDQPSGVVVESIEGVNN